MKHNQSPLVNKPIKALSESFSLAVISKNWIEFDGYSDFLVDVIGKASDRSISPNRSTILRSLFDIVNHVSILLLESGEYNYFTELSEKVITRYYGRNKKNETGDAVSYFAGDMVVSNYIKAIYDEIRKLAIEGRDYVSHRFKQLDSLKRLHFLFAMNRNPWAFQSIVSIQFSAIVDNASINNDQKSQILRENVKELFRVTEKDLNELLKTPYNLEREQVLDSYIYDWTSILKLLYSNNDKEFIELVFSFMSSSTLGNDLVEKKLYPCLAINLLMIVITDSHHEHEDKVSLLSFNIKGKYNKYNGITEYIRNQLLVKKLELLKRSYLSMVRLFEEWKEQSGRLSSFDYSPEVFLILVSAFMLDPCDYSEILKWTVVDRLPRCDRFPEIIDVIKKTVMSYPANDPNNRVEKALMSFSETFESTRYRLENETTELVTNLDRLKSEAFSLLSNT